jgi:glycosyltransferase involved in cell wall biosynthesis
MRYNLPFMLIALLKLVERFTLSRAEEVLVPDPNRITALEDNYRHKITIIYNCPVDVSFEGSEDLSHPFTVFFSGYIKEDRGINLLLRAAEKIPDMRVLVAGSAPDSELELKVKSHPQVDFRGYLPQEEALKLCYESDVIFAFYNPDQSEVYRRAASNKWYDAMMTSHPVLSNSELVRSSWIREEDIGYLCPYGDVAQLVETLEHIQLYQEEARRKGENARRLYESGYNWTAMEQRLRQLFDEAGDRNFH